MIKEIKMKATNHKLLLARGETPHNHERGIIRIHQTNLQMRRSLMKKQCLGMLMAVCFACCAFAQDPATIHGLRPFDKNHPPSTNCNGNPCAINYNGGGVFESGPTVYIIWYGDWTTKDESIIDYYFEHLSGSTQEKINTTYSDANNKFITGTLNHSTKNDYHDNYSLGKNLTGDSQIQEIVANAISGGHLPEDGNGIYFVLTYKDVTLPGFCSSFCGYHSPSTSIVTGHTIKYSMVGNPGQCPSSCEASVVIGDHNSPNGDAGADGTVNIMWHEFSESSSDPNINIDTAWAGNFKGNCNESGDCCAWLFGTLQVAPNGSHYNEVIGTKEFITQEMLGLQNTSRSGNVPGVCLNTLPENPASIVVRSSGEADVVVQGPKNSLLYYYANPGEQWNVTQIAGAGTTFSAPAIVVRSAAESYEADVVVQGPNNSLLYYYADPGKQWNVTQIAGAGTTFSAPAIVVRSAAESYEADVVAQGPNNSLLYYYADPGNSWAVTTVAGSGTTFSAPAIVVRSAAESYEADVVAQGKNNSLQYYYADPGKQWTVSQIAGSGTTFSAPAIVVRSAAESYEADVVAQGKNNSLQYYYADPGKEWDVTQIAGSGTTFSAPAIFVRSSYEADVVAQGKENSLQYYYAFPGKPWSVTTIAGTGSTFSPSEIAVRPSGEADVVAFGADDNSLLYYYADPGKPWSVTTIAKF
jgi:Phosphate-induced protein 1 conserved region